MEYGAQKSQFTKPYVTPLTYIMYVNLGAYMFVLDLNYLVISVYESKITHSENAEGQLGGSVD